CLEAPRIVQARDRVVDRAGADDDEQALVLAVDDVAQLFAALHHGLEGQVRNRLGGVQLLRRGHAREGGDVTVFDVWRDHVCLVALPVGLSSLTIIARYCTATGQNQTARTLKSNKRSASQTEATMAMATEPPVATGR